MEAVGSRLSRTSSRYSGPTTTTAVFSGRVRKWKKKWVHVSTPSAASFRTSKSNGRSNSSTNVSNNNTSHLLLCKWTPLSSVASADSGAGETEEPPRRRFRYTPVAVLEEKEKIIKKPETGTEEVYEFESEPSSPKSIELNMNMMDMNQTQETKAGHLDLGLCLKGLNDEDDTEG